MAGKETNYGIYDDRCQISHWRVYGVALFHDRYKADLSVMFTAAYEYNNYLQTYPFYSSFQAFTVCAVYLMYN